MFSFWLLPLSVAGLGISLHLLRKKLKKEKLVCFIGEDCDAVIKSKYGSMFGIPNEAIGSTFYAGMLLIATLSITGMSDIFETTLFPLVALSATFAFLSSVGLTGIQAFILRKWCEFCLATALINVLIFSFILFAAV